VGDLEPSIGVDFLAHDRDLGRVEPDFNRWSAPPS
jgi:hypothetical protein